MIMRKVGAFLIVLLLFTLMTDIHIGCDNDDSIVNNEESPPDTLNWLYRQNWFYASRPAGLDLDYHRAVLLWYNPLEKVPTHEIWDVDIAPGEGLVHVLNLSFYPDQIDRRIGADSNAVIIDPANTWGGIVHSIDASKIDLDSTKYLYIRLKGNKGILHVDLGEFSEDANNNGRFDNEDDIGVNPGIIEEIEDIGLDMMTDEQEQIYYNTVDLDPAGDNWHFEPEEYPYNYGRINGTQRNNHEDPYALDLPDSEDLNGNRILDLDNAYLSFKIDLAALSGQFLVENSENHYGWKSYLIPIFEPTAVDTAVGYPYWKKFKQCRLWVDSSDGNLLSPSIAFIEFMTTERLEEMNTKEQDF
jgi:cell surface protein SprA